MTFENAKASNWVMEGFSVIPTGFRLNGTDKGYTSFGRAFTDGDTVFYSATDEQGNREAGFGTYQANTIIDRKPTATLFNNVYNGTAPSPLPFSNGGTIAGTFNAVAFNTLWDHLYNTDNPHEVSAPQVHLEPALTPLDDQNVQSALEWLFSYFSEAAPDDWHLAHIDGNTTYIQINSGPDSEFPPTVEDLSFAELKLNHDAGHLWTRLQNGSIVKIGSQNFIEDAPVDGHVYGRMDGEWYQVSVVEVSDNRPDDPSVGDLWCDTARTMELYVYVNDQQGWVSMTGKGGIDSVIGDNIVLDDSDATMRNIALCREITQEGNGFWRPIFTSDVVTEGSQPMLGIDAGITSIEEVHNQHDANYFLYGSQVEGDADLQRQINDINVELEALATTREWGQWEMVATVPEVTAGKVNLDPLDFLSDTAVLQINGTDSSQTNHGFTEVVAGDYIELVGPEGFGLYTADGPAVDNQGSKKFELSMVRSNGRVSVGDTIDVKVFHLADTDIDLSDLDGRYAFKTAEHFNASHQTEDEIWYNAPHNFAISNDMVQYEEWAPNYYRIAHNEDMKGMLLLSGRAANGSGVITAKSWDEIATDNTSVYYLRNSNSRLDNGLLKEIKLNDVGNVIVLKQPSTGASLSMHITSHADKTISSETEHCARVTIRRKSGIPNAEGEWRAYLQKEYLSAKGHDHYVGTLNTREDRILRGWKSLSSNEFSLTSNTGTTPSDDSKAGTWASVRQFKVYSGQFKGSVIGGSFPNGLGLITVQRPVDTGYIMASYLTTSNIRSERGDHTMYVRPFYGEQLNYSISDWDSTLTVGTMGIIQNSRTQILSSQSTNQFSVDDEVDDDRPVWTGSNFSDFKGLDDFIAELKSAEPDQSTIDFLISQWHVYWNTPGQ